jgi:hypothetical protein
MSPPAIVSLLIGWQMQAARVLLATLRVQDFISGAWITAVGTSLLFIDVLGIILLYEFVRAATFADSSGRFLSRCSPWPASTASSSRRWCTAAARISRACSSPVSAGKATMALFYSIVAWAYLPLHGAAHRRRRHRRRRRRLSSG